MDEPTKPASGKEALKRESPDQERLLVIKEYISNLSSDYQEPPQEPALRQLRSYRVRPQLDCYKMDEGQVIRGKRRGRC